MERADLLVKTIVGVLTGIVSILTGLFGLVFTILLGLMMIDFITGVLAAAYSKTLNSSTGYKGLFKKVYTILLIGAVLMVEIAVLKSHGVITDGISGAFCVIEFISIVENGSKMGKTPAFLNKLVSTLKSKVGELDSEENTNKK